ncbi:carotenoid ester lipase precursor [Panus rudis PR-1116 ss-1]|nr:carotenoid ester lipase precursor [Panus rudis PR-1116 ss-1]
MSSSALFPSLVLLLAVALMFRSSTNRISSPTVTLDNGTFAGITDGVVDHFLGIAFAKPPVGNMRLRLPVANDPYLRTYSATEFGPACSQLAITSELPSGLLPPETIRFLSTQTALRSPQTTSEDCLSINVVRPSGIRDGALLPVAVWFYGGGFEYGASSLYDGTVIVNRSMELREPIVYVSFNYRLSAFGFLASKEVKDTGLGNLALHDQRLALRWIQKYVSAFGGDPQKVTIWGESAGAVSASLQMLTNGGDTEGLFRAAFLQSGFPIMQGDMSDGQKYYDTLISDTGCSNSSDSLECLRGVPYDTFKAAVDKSPDTLAYQSVSVAWGPRVDGKFIPDDPQKLVAAGSVARIPIVAGNVDDEGTLFALPCTNVTTEPQLRDYLTTYFIHGAQHTSDVDALLSLYPADLTQGSPFDTGNANAITPQFKRIAAILGDLTFQAPRRVLLQHTASKQDSWAFLSKRFKAVSVIGSTHASDVDSIFAGGDLTDFLINFVNHLDPNGKVETEHTPWPKYDTKSPQLLTLLDGPVSQKITKDTYRKAGMELLTTLTKLQP